MAQIELVKGNIVAERVDAIVNAANSGLYPGGGVCGAIHDAAGPELGAACQAITRDRGACPTGSARITPGFRLKARYVIHAVGPRYSGAPEEAARLASAYRESLRLAEQCGLRSIAFPSISTGIYGYPLAEAAPIAVAAVREALAKEAPSVALVRFVLFDDVTYGFYERAIAA